MPSQLSIVLNLGTLLGLPDWSVGPTGDPAAIAGAIKAAGYVGVQGSHDPAYRAAGLSTYGSGRILDPAEAYDLLAQHQDIGHLATTLHVGTGMERDAQALALLEAIVSASTTLNYPAHVETHRATITQDMARTLTWIEAVPDLTINADLSHWYTGLEMSYGDFPAKLDALAPVFDRVRFVHGRIGTSGQMQVPVGLGGRDQPHVGDFTAMWERCFAGFLRHARPDQTIVFAPELLPEREETSQGPAFINYAVTTQDVDGHPVEPSDRWDQALKLVDMAQTAFETAAANTSR